MGGLERFKGLGAGKRQAWTPIRSHGCGLGTPVGCEGLANGTLDRPEEAHKKPLMWPWDRRSHGCGLGRSDGSGRGVAVACVGGRPLDACWLKVARVLTFWGFGGFGGFRAFGGFGAF